MWQEIAAVVLPVGGVLAATIFVVGTILFRRSMDAFERHNERLFALQRELLDQFAATAHLEAWRARQAVKRRERTASAKKSVPTEKTEGVNDDAAA